MNEKQKVLASVMLDKYSIVLASNVCNDWHYPENWTEQEKAEFCKGYHDWNGDPEEFDLDNLHLPDFGVAAYLAHLMVESEPN
ncbi:hypothetical protein [Flavobacterium sp.]|jgi:hypothetical protein|uniref:hypothetical protein n=1 Tax=Flavobacterium sp. TaxID=239 RepID=UPI0037C08A84